MLEINTLNVRNKYLKCSFTELCLYSYCGHFMWGKDSGPHNEHRSSGPKPVKLCSGLPSQDQ